MYRVFRLTGVLIAVALLGVFSTTAAAAPGDLDPSFGSGGIVVDPNPLDTAFQTNDLALQPGGKIVTAGGEIDFGTGSVAAVQRFNANGTIDNSFGGGDGVAKVFPPSSDSSSFNAIKVLADGSILAAGLRVVTISPYTAQFLLVKLTPEGDLDTTFDGDVFNSCGASNGNGIVCTQVNAAVGQDTASGMDVQADGGIVLAGNSYITAPGNMAAARYTPTGALDSTFSGDGKLVLPVGTSSNYARNVLIKPNQQIVLTGVARALAADGAQPPVMRNADDIAVVQLNTDGSPDTGFDGDASNLIAPSAATEWSS